MRGRVRELEQLCTDVLVAAVDLGLPQPLLNRLWAAVGHGELPHAFSVDLPPKRAPGDAAAAAPAPEQPAGRAAESPPSAPSAEALEQQAPNVNAPPGRASGAKTPAGTAASAPMPIPDIPLTTNPLLSTGAPASKPTQPELAPLTTRKTVAVVDDDPMMLDVLERILQRENFELLMAGGGPEIIAKLETHAGGVDLLVTDYAMPAMQGRELADRVRKRYPTIKVLYQTGFSDMLFENRVELEEGAAFLEKPFTARGLREAARMVLFGTLNPS